MEGRLGDARAPYRSPTKRREIVARRLDADRDCWLATSHPEHGPYVVPLSFVCQEGNVFLSTHERRPAVRNVLSEPRVMLVLGGHADAITLVGECAVLPLDSVGGDVRERYVRKAGWAPEAGSGFVMLKVRADGNPVQSLAGRAFGSRDLERGKSAVLVM